LKSWSQLRLGRKAAAGVAPELPLLGDGHGPPLRLREPRVGPPEPPPAKAQRFRPLPAAGIALVLVAIVGYLAVYSQTTKRTPVLVAARDLPAGTVLRAGDLRSAGLAGDRQVLGSLVPSRQRELVLGRRLTTAVPAGLPLPRTALANRAVVPGAFTVPIPVLHALGGELRPGDRVTVLATFQAAGGGAQTRAIARGLEVLAVGQPPSGIYQSSATVPVTLALPDPSLASQLALASEAGKIDLLREGTRPGAPIPPARLGG
jgi:Flp pilus assembly protein CpaB